MSLLRLGQRDMRWREVIILLGRARADAPAAPSMNLKP